MRNLHSLAPSVPIGGLGPSQAEALQVWSNLLQWLPVGIYVCARDGTISLFNRRAAELRGRTADADLAQEHYSGACRQLSVDGRTLPASDSPVGRVLETGEPVRDEELWIERPDGSRIAVVINVDPDLSEEGERAEFCFAPGGVRCRLDIPLA
jgi:PAS domain-containing protein